MEEKKINILCVEDGSVDLDALAEGGLHDGDVLVYRQGSTPPFILSLKKPEPLIDLESKYAEATKELEELKGKINDTVIEMLLTVLRAVRGKSDGYTNVGEFIYVKTIQKSIYDEIARLEGEGENKDKKDE